MGDKYLCPKCQETYDAEDLTEIDHGGYEEAWGSRVWNPCLVLYTPCCGIEAEPIEKPWWMKGAGE